MTSQPEGRVVEMEAHATAAVDALNALESAVDALPKVAQTRRGPHPTPPPVSPRKAARRRAAASRKANR